jgi:adenylate kinase family enzyme
LKEYIDKILKKIKLFQRSWYMKNDISIYMITGVMASGKSTIAELLAKKIDKSVHLRGDIFRKMIVSGREEMSENSTEEALIQLNLRYKITAQVAKEYYMAGFNVIMQDNYYGETINEMVEFLFPYKPKIIVLNPNIETIKSREMNRSKKGYTGFTEEKLYKDFMEKTPRIGFWIDTSNIDPEETVNKILEYNKLM